MNSTVAGSWRDQLAQLDAEGRTEDALDVLRRAAFERPDDADLGFMVGERLKKSGHLSDAAVVFALVSSLDNEHMRFRALLERAECLRLTGDYSGASVDISRAMSIDPGSHWPVVAMAEVYSSAGRDGERLEFIERHYDALRPDGKAELARYASGMQAYWHFEATRRQSWWRPRSPGRVLALERVGFLMMIKDEDDIIRQNLEHHYSIGFRFFCLIDNGSTDSTKEKIGVFEKNHADAVILYIRDPIVGYYQAEKMDIFQNTLVRYLKLIDIDLDWMFFIDADEFISFCGESDDVGIESLNDTLLEKSNSLLVFHWVNAASNKIIEKIPDESDVFSIFSKINSKLLPVVPKVALRNGLRLKPMMGNHFIEQFSGNLDNVRSAATFDWYIMHFPLRSESHVKTKIINGGKAFLSTKNLENHGGHWRERYLLYQNHGESIVTQVLQNHIDSIMRL
jgi:tetratricopeptide (TPR) repeat protein